MKLILEVNDQEKKEILEQHNLFKNALQSKVKKLMVNEQTQPGGGVEFLKAARDKGCKIAVGGVIKSAPGKPSVLYKVADYDSANGYFKKGDELYIKDDFTFDVVSVDASGNKTLSASNKKWACSALTKPVEDQIKTNIDLTQKEGGWKKRGDITDTDANFSVENQQVLFPVGRYKPNNYGLYDMAGNVWEWCWDWKENYSVNSQNDPRGPSNGGAKVIRGGSLCYGQRYCRVSDRYFDGPYILHYCGGFRSVLPPGQP